jgi:hypothetical protein
MPEKIKCKVCGFPKMPDRFRWDNKKLGKRQETCSKCLSKDEIRERERLANKPINDLIRMRWV